MVPRTFGILSLAILLLATCAFADTGTNWTLGSSPNNAYCWEESTCQSSTNQLFASGISVTSVTGVGSGNTLAITNGSLSFTTGAWSGGWSWGGGDGATFDISGCIGSYCSQELLKSTDFSGVTIVPLLQLGQYTFDVEISSLDGLLDSTVAADFGISRGFSATTLNLIFTQGTYGDPFYGRNAGGKIVTTVNTNIAASEDWGLASMLGFFALAASVFGLAWRLGFVKPVAF